MKEKSIKSIERDLLQIAQYDKSIVEIDIVGSYAKKMQNYNSDIDVIFIYKNRINEDALFMIIGEIINRYKILIHPILLNKEFMNEKNRYFCELLLNKITIYRR